MTVGIPITKIVSGFRKYFGETMEFVKNREEIQRLQVQMGAAASQPKKLEALRNRIRVLEDANRALSIRPLIEAGEFATIAEGLDEADIAIREGDWAGWLQQKVEKLPGWTSTAAKNVLITKDTALYKGLNRMVSFGDFVAKAVLYEHLTETKGAPQRQALDVIFEEFVPYNRLPGRDRDAAESLGLLWFWNYKLRIMKILGRTMRDRPLSALMMMGGLGPSTGIDTVGDGSLAGAWLDGRLPYAMGVSANRVGLLRLNLKGPMFLRFSRGGCPCYTTTFAGFSMPSAS